MRIATVIAFGAWLCSSASAWAQGEFPLKYQEAALQHPLIASSFKCLRATPQKPSQLRGSPAGLSDEAQYFVAQMGGKPVVMALDCSGEPKLYVDTNGNGDLSDEKPLDGRIEGLRVPQFGPCTVRLPSREVTVRIVALGKDTLNLYPTGFMSGQVQIEGGTHAIALMDSNFDGLYNVLLPLPVSLPSARRGTRSLWTPMATAGFRPTTRYGRSPG